MAEIQEYHSPNGFYASPQQHPPVFGRSYNRSIPVSYPDNLAAEVSMARPILVSGAIVCRLAGADSRIAESVQTRRAHATLTVATAAELNVEQHDVHSEPNMGSVPSFQHLH